MAKYDNVFGAAMELNIDDLKGGLKDAQNQIKTANKTFAAQTSGMDSWKDSADGLTAKLEQLETTLSQQKRVYGIYEEEIKRVSALEGDHTEELRRLNDKLLDAQAAIGKTERSYRYYSKALEEVEAESKDAAQATDKLERELKDAEDAADNLRGGFTVLKGALANLAATGISSMVSGLQGIVSESREFRREMGYLEQAAKDAGVSFDEAKEHVKDVTAITDDQGAAIEGLNNLMTSGFDGAALDTITDQLLGASIKWKDTLNFESLSGDLQESLAVGEATGQFGELLDRAGVNVDSFNENLSGMTTEADKQNYVMSELSKLGLAGVVEGYREANKSLVEGAEAEYEYAEAMAEVGEELEPVLTSLKITLAGVLKELVPIIKDAINFVMEHKDTILGLIAGIGAGFLAWKAVTIIQGVITAMKAWMVATQGMTAAQRLLNLVMAANPIGIVITVIAALVAAFVVLWNKSDAFRQFWINLWNSIKNATKAVVDWLSRTFSSLWNGIKSIWSGATGFFSGIWGGIKKAFSSVASTIGGFFRNAWTNVKNAWSGVSTWFSDLVAKIVKFFTDIPSKMLDIGKDIMEGLLDGIKSMADKIKDAVMSPITGAVDKVKGWLGIKSPSTLMRDEVGKMMGLGVAEGLEDSTSSVVREAQKFSRGIGGGLSSAVASVAGTGGVVTGGSAGNMNSVTNNFTQNIIAPKQPKQIELYRYTRNQLKYAGGYRYV